MELGVAEITKEDARKLLYSEIDKALDIMFNESEMHEVNNILNVESLEELEDIDSINQNTTNE